MQHRIIVWMRVIFQATNTITLAFPSYHWCARLQKRNAHAPIEQTYDVIMYGTKNAIAIESEARDSLNV